MATVVLLTGGNQGAISENMMRARTLIAERIGRITSESKIYFSQAWGFESQSLFQNQVLSVETDLMPERLLDATQTIELELGRVRHPEQSGYASRTMDIDILYYDRQVIDTERLQVPHPLISRREFVLRPLSEIMGTWQDPRTRLTVEAMLRACLNS